MKKNFKRLAALGLAAAMTIASLSGCSSGKEPAGSTTEAPKETTTAAGNAESTAAPSQAAGEFTDYSAGFPEKVTIQIPIYERGWEGWDPCDNYWTKWIQENFGDKYNVEIEWISIGRSTEVTDFTQLLSAGSAPTIIFHYDYPNILQYYSEDAYQPLNAEEIAYYAPNYWEKMGDTIQEYGVINDELMVIMGSRTELLSSNYGTIIRKDWMDKVGVDMPQNLTEYNDMLRKWKDAGLGYASDYLLMKSFNFDYSFRGWPNDAEGRALNSDLAVASLSWEPTKAFLKNMNEQYNEGLITPEFYLDTDGSQCKADFLSGKAGTWSCYINQNTLTDIENLMASFPEAELAILDPAAKAPEGEHPEGRKYWPFGMIYGINEDATDEQRIAVWMYIEWMNDPEVLATLQSGFEGMHYEVKDGIKVSLGYTGEERMSNNDNQDYYCLVASNKSYATQEEWAKSIVNANGPKGYEYLIQEILDYNDKYDEWATPDTCFTVPIASLSEYSTELATLWQESYVKLVRSTPEEFDALYDELSQEYLDAGYQEILDEKKAAYDAGYYH